MSARESESRKGSRMKTSSCVSAAGEGGLRRNACSVLASKCESKTVSSVSFVSGRAGTIERRRGGEKEVEGGGFEDVVAKWNGDARVGALYVTGSHRKRRKFSTSVLPAIAAAWRTVLPAVSVRLQSSTWHSGSLAG